MSTPKLWSKKLLPVIVYVGIWPSARGDEAWVQHSSFEDFAAGVFEDGGVNLFLSREGTLQMLHRLDFNNDGYLDLWVGQDHDVVENVDAFVYWGTPDGPVSIMPPLPHQQPLARKLQQIRQRETAVLRLPSDGGGRCLLVDLNNDGYLEIVFCNYIHNYSVHMNALIYWGSAAGYAPRNRTELPTLMAGGLAAADFDGDGLTDLAFANQGIEGGERFGFDKHLESYVYWNGPKGFSVENRTSLPTVSATDCVAGDVNGDGYPELLFANNNSQHQSIFLYWGSKEGFSAENREAWEGGEPVGLELANIDNDNLLDLVVAHADNRAELWRGNGAGFDRWTELPTIDAIECRVSDLNRDGRPDLVFANRGSDQVQNSFIYWAADDGFAAARRTELPTTHANDACLADFNNDGWTDVVFANEHDGQTYDVNCYLYWNGPDGFQRAHRKELQGLGSVHAGAADLNLDGQPDLVLVNRHSGTVGDIDSMVYWGNPRHHYSPSSMSILRKGGPGGAAAIVDLNQDQFVDIVFPAGFVFWGSQQGFSNNRREHVGLTGQGVSVADFNRDGHLDLLFPVRETSPDAKCQGVVLWGSQEGFDATQRTVLQLRSRYCQSGSIADFNRDGWLDLIFGDVDSPAVDLFWGGPQGFSNDRCARFTLNNASTIEIADLNADGWLDFTLGGGWDATRFGRPTREAMIVWGSRDGFSEDQVTRLEAYNSLEQSVADLNKDGRLDLILTNYHAYFTRTLPLFIYWGSSEGTFSESRRTSLSAESSSALTVADLNQDGWFDVVACNHIRQGDHGVGTNIFWGTRDGYSAANRHWFQTFGAHFGLRWDVGNIYDRRLEERYNSAPLQCPVGRRPSRISWKARQPQGTTVKVQIRTAANRDDLAEASWQGPAGKGSWYEQSGAALNHDDSTQWIQYRVALGTRDGGSTPYFDSIQIDVD